MTLELPQRDGINGFNPGMGVGTAQDLAIEQTGNRTSAP